VNVALVYGAPVAEHGADEQDVLVQLAAIRDALHQLGQATMEFPMQADCVAAAQWLKATCPDVVFNLVESLDGDARLIDRAPALFEQMGIAFTGCSADAIRVTSHKLLCKERLLRSDIATPAWFTDAEMLATQTGPRQWIVKPIDEDASVGIDDDSVCHSAITAASRLHACLARGRGWFAEEFIDGREVNISLLARPHGVEVLPPAEILFQDFPSGKPHIVGYAAKWRSDSFEYHHTPRDFARIRGDSALTGALMDTASTCWDLFDLSGFARVDCRVDADGRIWVLEVNANPCLSPDAGFAAAATAAGYTFADTIGRILASAIATD
jgi:D-alanine-D-alanine ligase